MRITRALAALALFAALGGCTSNKAETKPDEETTTEPTPVEAPAPFDVVAAYQDGVAKYAAGDWDSMSALLADDIVTVDVGMGTAEGKEAAVESMKQEHAPFPDIKIGVARIFKLGDDFIAIEGVTNGNNTGAMGDKPATNKPAGVNFLQLAWFADGKLKRMESISNPMTIMQQLGVAPLPKGAVAPALPAMPTDTEIVEGEANPANEAVAKAFYAAFGTEAAAAMMAEGFTLTHHGINKTMDPKQLGEHMKMMGKGLTAMSLEPQKVYSVGDWVVAELAFSAKHTGEVMGMKATNKEISCPVYHVLQVTDGKIASATEYINVAQLAGQMMPAQQAAK